MRNYWATGILKKPFRNTGYQKIIYYIVESEILKIYSEIFSISSQSSENIDHATFSNLLLSVHEISQYFAWDYIISSIYLI